MFPIELTFLGTGTSAGVPMIGCDCRVCTSADPRDRRTRCSVVARYATTTVLVDTTPELRLQAVAADLRHVDAVVLTHGHADHIMGLDDLRRFNTLGGRVLDVWADAPTFATVERCFGYAFSGVAEQGVYRPQLKHRLVEDAAFDLGGLLWKPVPLLHGAGTVLGFRFGKIAYCTDASAVPPASLDLLRGLDVLVLDALQRAKHPTHLTIDEALAVIDEVKPKAAYLTHMSHNVMHAEVDATLPAGVSLAHDGLRVMASA